MAREPNPLPSAREIAEALEMPLEEALALLERMRFKQQRRRFLWPTLTLGEALVVVAFTGVLAAVLFPTHCGSRERARRSSCLSNVKQLSNALLMYASDYDERLPPANVWHDAIFPYVKNEWIWHCPTRKERVPSYSYNALLHCRSLTEVGSPKEQPMLFETDVSRRNAADLGVTFITPHNQRGAVGYVDGHVRLEASPPAADLGLKRR